MENNIPLPVPVLLDRFTTLTSLAAESKNMQQFRFRGAMQQLPVVRVRIDFPVYRTGNHRTKTLQEEYLAKHPDLPKSFFQKDSDSSVVQNAQREILETLLNQQELLESFKKASVDQEEPLLCTRDGVVVNGNRRLCAWRKLFAEDPIQYKRFESVELQLLPSDCTEEDVNDIERELQIKKTHRAEYSWHTKAAMIQEMFDAGSRSKAQIAELFDTKPSEIDLAIECYVKAREYLDSIGHSGEWSRVDKDEFAFRKIVSEEKKIRDEGLKEIFAACTTALLQATPEDVGNRMYGIIPKLAENLHTVAEIIENELLPDDAKNGTARVKAMKAAVLCRKTENIAKAVELVKAVIDAAGEKETDREKGLSLLHDLTDISTRLVSAKTRDLDDRQKDLRSALCQIHEILKSATFIKEWIEHHVSQD